MVEVPEALTGRNSVEGGRGKVKILRRRCKEVYFHAGFPGKAPGLTDLLRGNIRAGPLSSVFIHVPGKDSGAGAKVQDLLPLYADPPLPDLLIKDLRIDVSVPGIVF